MAEAFRSVATSSGTATALNIYLDQTSTATQLIVGVYADAGGKPGALLSSGRSVTPAAGGWNAISVDPLLIRSGQAYWLADPRTHQVGDRTFPRPSGRHRRTDPDKRAEDTVGQRRVAVDLAPRIGLRQRTGIDLPGAAMTS
jgi:hypothetical protein